MPPFHQVSNWIASSKKLCSAFKCIKPKKGEQLSVDAVVTGEVSKKSVELKVYTDEETEPVSKTIALGAGAKIAKKALAQAPKAVKEALAALEEEEETDESEESAGIAKVLISSTTWPNASTSSTSPIFFTNAFH